MSSPWIFSFFAWDSWILNMARWSRLASWVCRRDSRTVSFLPAASFGFYGEISEFEDLEEDDGVWTGLSSSLPSAFSDQFSEEMLWFLLLCLDPEFYELFEKDDFFDEVFRPEEEDATSSSPARLTWRFKTCFRDGFRVGLSFVESYLATVFLC